MFKAIKYGKKIFSQKTIVIGITLDISLKESLLINKIDHIQGIDECIKNYNNIKQFYYEPDKVIDILVSINENISEQNFRIRDEEKKRMISDILKDFKKEFSKHSKEYNLEDYRNEYFLKVLSDI